MSLAQCKVSVQVEKWHSQAPCWTLFLEWSVSLRLRRPNGSGQCGSHRCAAPCPEGVAKATWGWTVAHLSALVLEVADQRGGIAKKTFFCRLAAKVWLKGQGSSWSHNLRSLCALRWMAQQDLCCLVRACLAQVASASKFAAGRAMGCWKLSWWLRDLIFDLLRPKSFKAA